MTTEAKAGPVPSHKRQLRHLLLDKSYQLRYTTVIVLISAALTTGLGILVVSTAREATRTIKPGLALLDDEMAARVAKDLDQSDRSILLAIAGFGVIFCFAMAAYGIVITHKVAGPLYKLSVYLNHIRDGKLGHIYDLRRGDQLHTFYNVFKQMHEALRKRTQQEIEVLDAAIAGIEKAGTGSDEVRRRLDELRALKQAKEESLN
jgi:methyl-accepting chemotaxis protein